MRSLRSGAPPRFLLYRSPEYWVPRGELVAFNLLMGFMPFVGGLFLLLTFGTEAIHEIADPRNPIHHLGAPLDAEERRLGVTRVGGRLTGDVCLVVNEHYNGKEWEELRRDTLGKGALLGADGITRTVPWDTVAWDPPIPLDGDLHTFEENDRSRGGCLHAGDPVFLDGCTTTRAPTSDTPPLVVEHCSSRRLVLTPFATARPRLDALAADLAGRASLLGYAAFALLVYFWRVFGTRPTAGALIRRLRRPFLPATATAGRLVAVILGPAALLAATWYVPRLTHCDGPAQVARFGYAGPYLAALAALTLVFRMLDSLRALRAVSADVRAGREPPLDRLRAGEATALDAEVDPAAPLSRGPLTRAQRAHWTVATTRVFKSGRNHASVPGPETRGPQLVPIVTRGGPALLDLTHAVVDLRARRHRVRRSLGRKASFESLLGPEPGMSCLYLLEERFLDRGEAVHVLGRVQRFEAGPGGVNVPVIGGAPGDPAFVHAGTRASLLRHLAVERRYLTVALPLTVGIVLAGAALTAYLASF